MTVRDSRTSLRTPNSMMSVFGTRRLGGFFLLAVLTACLSSDITGSLSITWAAEPETGSLANRLQAENLNDLASAAEQEGDATRGAVAFHQATLACNRCHAIDGRAGSIGPDLTSWEKRPATTDLIESILHPSRKIRSGYETALVVRIDGTQTTGLFVEQTPTAIVLRNAESGKLVSTPVAEIEEWTKLKRSSMPEGVVNQLGTRQQFLDLIAYLREIATGGPARAKELQPPTALLVARPLPEYEANIDHAGLIRSFDDDAFRRGEEIYERLCANCHGTRDRPGTLPTSRRFATDRLRNDRDPYAMYQTLTRGFGMMVAQHWMVPRQKYDVVHYIREAYLREHNPSQYFDVTETYLKSLPQGGTFGPEPSRIQPWSAMDYGPSLVNTYEFGSDGENIAQKGIAMRLDGGSGGVSRGRAWAVFEHDTLRLAGFWTGQGFIDWNGIHFNGRHGIHPRVVGQVHLENTGPGWMNPQILSFDDDKRITGRDGRRYGPLPKEWGQYEGLAHVGNSTIIRYRVGKSSVLEMPTLMEVGDERTPVLVRHFEIGPRPDVMMLSVATRREGATKLDVAGQTAILRSAKEPEEAKTDREPKFEGDTYLEVESGTAFETTNSFTVTARIRTTKGGTIFARTTPGPEWVPGGQVLFVQGGRLCYDIGWVGVLRSNVRVADGKWHDVGVTFDAESGIATLLVDGRVAGSKRLRPQKALERPVIRIGYCAPDFPKPTAFEGELESVRCFASTLDADDLKRIAGGTVDETDLAVAHWNLGSVAEGKTVPNRLAKRLSAKIRTIGEASVETNGADVIVAGTTGNEGLVFGTFSDSRLTLTIPPGEDTIRFAVWATSTDSVPNAKALRDAIGEKSQRPIDLSAMMNGGPPRWPETIETVTKTMSGEGPFAVENLTPPASNPWFAQMRLTGFDFFTDRQRMAVCSWDGDVWLVDGLHNANRKLTWKRIASGLFQPLGLKIVDGQIFVTCRDQLVILRDRNGDGETDYYEAFNSDHQVTEHFHEFAMGLQRDDEGNFYYAKSARHALPAVVPHHGTLLRISADGERTDILATGFRAANGVCLNPDGTFFVTDQEGHWTPKNRINHVREGRFYGNMMGYHDITDPSDDAMQPPLCWLTNAFDRSPAELLWVDSKRWGALDGKLLSLSYGYGKIFVVPHERVGTGSNSVMQGGASALPIPDFPTGLVRGRFHPEDGELYVCGMFAWAGSQQHPGGLYRIRRTDQPLHVPIEFHAEPKTLSLGFTDALDPEAARDPGNYTLKVWSLNRTKNYGSRHVDERTLTVERIEVGADGKTITLHVPELTSTMGLAVRWTLKSKSGSTVTGELHGTINR